MNEFQNLAEITPIGLAALAIAFSWWVLKYKNNGNGYKGIREELTTVKSNHLTHIQDDITRLLESNQKIMALNEKQLYILEEIKESLKNRG